MNSLISSETSRRNHFPKACQVVKKLRIHEAIRDESHSNCNNLQWHLLVESLYCLHLVLKMASDPPTSTTVSANSKQGDPERWVYTGQENPQVAPLGFGV